MSAELLKEIVKIARSVDAYVLCDEVYRHLTQEDIWCESIVDLYEKGISVSSMSKVFSLAGLRLGWIATHDEALRQSILSHRDYNHISCGMFDESLAAVALAHSDKILERNRGIVRENLGCRASRGSTTISPRRVRQHWSITTMPRGPMTSVRGCTMRRVLS